MRDRDGDVRASMWEWTNDAIANGESMMAPGYDVAKLDLIPYLGKMYNMLKLRAFGTPDASPRRVLLLEATFYA